MAAHRRAPSRPVTRTLTAALMVLMVTGAGLAVASRVLNVRVLTEHSDSMYPAIETGDLVLSRTIRTDQARVGDIVTFPDLSLNRRGELLTHRVTAVRRAGYLLVVTTRGDANTGDEQWTASPDTEIGRTIGVVPRLGRVLAPLNRPAVAATLNGGIVTLLILLGVAQIRAGGPVRVRRRRSPAVP